MDDKCIAGMSLHSSSVGYLKARSFRGKTIRYSVEERAGAINSVQHLNHIAEHGICD